MVDAYKCECRNQFDVDRVGDRAADEARCDQCGELAKRKIQIQIRRPRRLGRAVPNSPQRPPAPPQPDRPRTSLVGLGGKSTGSRFYLYGDHTVDAGVHVRPGADAQVDELHIAGPNIDIYNEGGHLDAPGAEID